MLHTRFKMMLVMSAILILAPIIAFAADAVPATQTMGDVAVDAIHKFLMPFLLSLVTSLGAVVLNKVRQKTGLQVSAERQAQLDGLARQAIAMAEEKAAAFIKEKNNEGVTGANKLNMAIAYMIGKAPTVTPEQADALIHVALGQTIGAGATGTAAVFPPA